MSTSTATRTTITIPLEEAITAFSAVAPHRLIDKDTPILGTSGIVLDDGVTYVTATDRYSVARVQLSTGLDADDTTKAFIVPRDVVDWVTKIAPKSLRRHGLRDHEYSLTITDGDDGVEVSIVLIVDGDIDGLTIERSQVFDKTVGNYPPVHRLFAMNDMEPGGEQYRISVTALAKVIASIKAITPDKQEQMGDWHWFTQTGRYSANKTSAPLLITSGPLSMLIQPNNLR